MTTGTLGPRLARKPLHLFWILDTSGSMGVAGKIDALNQALRDAVPALRDAIADNPGVELLVRVVTFDHDARWHVADPVPIEQFEWSDVAVTPDGTTEVGRAIDLVTDQIREVAAARRGMPPALVLVSDGRPTDLKQPTFGASVRALMDEPWGLKASRMAIGIGADADMDALARFIGHDEIKPLLASNASELAHYLRWASTVVVGELSRTGGAWDEVAADDASTESAVPAPEPVQPGPDTPAPAPASEPVARQAEEGMHAENADESAAPAAPPPSPEAPAPGPVAAPMPPAFTPDTEPTEFPDESASAPVGDTPVPPPAPPAPPEPAVSTAPPAPPVPPPPPPPPPPGPAEVDDDITW